MAEKTMLLAIVNVVLIIIVLILLKKPKTTRKQEPVEEAPEKKKHNKKLKKIRQMIDQDEISDNEALIRGMISQGKTDTEIINELRKKGLKEQDIKKLLESIQ